MSVPAQLEPRDEGTNARTATRRKLRLQARGATSIHPAAQVLIHDLSETGVLIETSADLSIGERLEVHIPEAGATAAKVVWNSGRFFGCEFRTRIPRGAVSAAMLRSPVKAPAAPPLLAEPVSSKDERSDEESGKEWAFGAKLRLVLTLTLAFAVLNWLIVWLFS